MKTPRLLALFLLSMTLIALIPPVTASPTVDVRPTVVNEDQSILIMFSVPDNSTLPGALNLTIYYGGVEQKNWDVMLNESSYSTSLAIPAHWYYGGYTVRADFGGESYFADFQYRMSDEHQLLVLQGILTAFTSTANGVTSNSAAMLATVVVLMVVWSVILLLFFQHIVAHNIIFIDEDDKVRKFTTDSWIDRIVGLFRRIRTGHPTNTTVGRMDIWKGAAARDKLNRLMIENPRTRNLVELRVCLDDIYRFAEDLQERDIGSVRNIGSETPDGSPTELLEIAKDAAVTANIPSWGSSLPTKDFVPPSIGQSPPKERKRSKPPGESSRKAVPKGGIRLVKDIPMEERQ